MFLICKNIANEGPETIVDYLDATKISYEVVDLYKGEIIANPNAYSGLIMMGGPMSVNDKLPFIEYEIQLAQDFILNNKKVLGICLGAQIMAKALGANVYLGAKKEIGWYNINFTIEAERDKTISALILDNANAKVFQWHGETFDIPYKAQRLAYSALYPNQAFKYGNNAYALQFHIEVKKETIFSWLALEADIELSKIMHDTELFYDDFHKRTMAFYENFFK